jgi:REP element-mobilizing transposase RayT
MRTVQQRHNQRLTGFSYVGFHRYFLTFCTINRARVFTSAPPVDLVLAQILRAAGECSFAVPTYCVMPDHLQFSWRGNHMPPTAWTSSIGRSSIPAFITRRRTLRNCGSDMRTTTSCAMTTKQSSSPDTSSIIRFGPAWCGESRIIRTADHWSIRSRRFWIGFAENRKRNRRSG